VDQLIGGRPQGTWLIEQACPKAKIICLDITYKNLVYKSTTADYIEEDFSLVDFSDFDKSNSICFFDDHQNALMRLQQMKWKGFNRAIFEDNYPQLRGDCYSIKKMFGDFGFENEKSLPPSTIAKIKYLAKQVLRGDESEKIPPNATHRLELHKNLKIYFEVPPLFKSEKTRWGDDWCSPYYPTKSPLFDGSTNDELRVEEIYYTWMCYVETL
jgi:hypothetical protein